MAWVNGLLIGASVSVAGFMALIGAFKLITSGSDQRKHEEGITTLRNVGIGVLVMALVIPAVNVGASRLGLGTIAEPETNITPTAEIGSVNLTGASNATISISYTKTVRVTNAASGDDQLHLAVQNLSNNTFHELDVTVLTAPETQAIAFDFGTGTVAAGDNFRILGYRYGTATISDASTGDPAISSFPQQPIHQIEVSELSSLNHSQRNVSDGQIGSQVNPSARD